MMTGLLLGGSLGAALFLFIYALVPPQPRLATVVTRYERGQARQDLLARDMARTETTAMDDMKGRLGRWLVSQLATRGITMGKQRADLELTGSTLEAHLVRKIGAGVVGLLLPTVFALVLFTVGVSVPFTIPAVVGVAFGLVLFLLPDIELKRAAEARRFELRRALSCYLDFVSMSLAGGRGIPEALPTSARIGTGWAFELIRHTIEEARLVGDTPWQALADLGDRTGMQELQDLGGSLLLVAEDGNKVRASLTARAASLRKRQLTEAEGDAEKAGENTGVANVLLFLGFLVFLMYPAAISIMGL